MPKIVKMYAENVKRIRVVEVTPKGHVVKIRGRNEQGKSSILDAIAMAIGGKTLQPSKVIRDGEKGAIVSLELDNGFVIERKWKNNDTSTLELRDKDGAKVSSPQAKLDELITRATFDPLEFLKLDERKQVEVLRRLVKLDFTILDENRKKVYDARTEINRRVEHAKIRLLPLRDFSDTEPVKLDELSEEVAKLSAQRADEQDALRQVKRHDADVKENGRRIVDQEDTINRLKNDLERATNRLEEMKREQERLNAVDLTALREKAAHEVETLQELEGVKAKIKNAEEINERARKCAERRQMEQEIEDLAGESDLLTKEIDEIDARKKAALESAKFPIPELSFDGDTLVYKGEVGTVPFAQASAAAKLRASVGMGLALNPRLKVLLVRDASLLDDDNLRIVSEMAAAADAQVWLEYVGKNGSGIVIEDGEVEAINPEEEEAPI